MSSGYGYDDEARPRGLLVVLVLVVLVVPAVVLGWWWTQRDPEAPAAADPASPTAQVSSPAPGPSSPSSPTSAAPSGRDASEQPVDDPAPAGSTQAAAAFVEAWLSRGTDRSKLLARTCTADLAEQLGYTDPAVIPDARPEELSLIGASAYAAEFEQTLSDGSGIVVLLVADPAAEHGWLAQTVRPQE